jgi:hypothetical protein
MICVLLTEYDKGRYTTVQDVELNELLQEIRTEFKGVYLLREYFVKQKRGFFTSWFKEDEYNTFYELYADLGHWDTQVINFARESGSSINTLVPKSYIITYFLGLLNGKKHR